MINNNQNNSTNTNNSNSNSNSNNHLRRNKTLNNNHNNNTARFSFRQPSGIFFSKQPQSQQLQRQKFFLITCLCCCSVCIFYILYSSSLSPSLSLSLLQQQQQSHHYLSSSSSNNNNNNNFVLDIYTLDQYMDAPKLSKSTATSSTTITKSTKPKTKRYKKRILPPKTLISTISSSSISSSMSKNKTKIIGFTDYQYKDVAYRWYQELQMLGYDNHIIVTWDTMTRDYFNSIQQIQQDEGQQQQIRHEYVFESIPTTKKQDYNNNNTSSSSSSSLRDECEFVYSKLFNDNKRNQMYRRSLFGSRWYYVLQQLQKGYHVLLTDVDNVYTQYKSMNEMEDSNYDVFHAFAGTVPSFPLNIFQQLGFTICGGMSWFRSIPSVIEFVHDIVSQCGCRSLHCTCYCDDQVVLNKYVLATYNWDDSITIPTSIEEMSWKGYTGYCNKTGHRVKIWDRDVAYRDEFNETNPYCPNPKRNWIAMPTGISKGKMWDTWKEYCPSSLSTSTLSTTSTLTSQQPQQQQQYQQIESIANDSSNKNEQETIVNDEKTRMELSMNHTMPERIRLVASSEIIPSKQTISTSLNRLNKINHDIIDENNNHNNNNSPQQPTPSTSSTSSSKTTKIIGFADYGYKEIAYKWYQELELLGYTEHYVAAQDGIAAAYFQSKGMRYDLVYNKPRIKPIKRIINSSQQQQQSQQSQVSSTHRNLLQVVEPSTTTTASTSSTTTATETTVHDNNTNPNITSLRDACENVTYKFLKPAKQKQMYRHSLFGSRWYYVWKQLEQGYHVLLTDVDNVFTQYKSMKEMEDDDNDDNNNGNSFDIYHAYAGTIPSYPLDIYRRQGFTVCGGMSWLRSTPSIIQLAKYMATSCGCQILGCNCYCDDQVNLNKFILHECTWDGNNDNNNSNMTSIFNKLPPKSFDDLHWEGLTGYCNLSSTITTTTTTSTTTTTTKGQEDEEVPKGYRMKIWNRHVAYRAELTQPCPDPKLNWIAMPIGVMNRTRTWEEWREQCPK